MLNEVYKVGYVVVRSTCMYKDMPPKITVTTEDNLVGIVYN